MRFWAMTSRWGSRAMCRLTHRVASSLGRPSDILRATCARALPSAPSLPTATTRIAPLAALSPPLSSPWRAVGPDGAGRGATPHGIADDGSPPSPSGLSPAAIVGWAATCGPTHLPSGRAAMGCQPASGPSSATGPSGRRPCRARAPGARQIAGTAPNGSASSRVRAPGARPPPDSHIPSGGEISGTPEPYCLFKPGFRFGTAVGILGQDGPRSCRVPCACPSRATATKPEPSPWASQTLLASPSAKMANTTLKVAFGTTTKEEWDT